MAIKEMVSGSSYDKQGQILEKNPSLNLGNVSLLPTVGFISPPAYFDPSPYEFTTVVQESVLTQQAMPLLPDFDFSFDNLASEHLAEHLCLCARSLQAAGCSVVVQVGNPFAWANVKSEVEARRRNDRITAATNLPTIMTTLAVVDALRSYQAKKIAMTTTFYSSAWNKDFASFMALCGFEVVHTSNFYQQGLAKPINADDDEEHFRYADLANPVDEMSNLIKASVQVVKEKVSDCEAIAIVGTGARTLAILCDLEAIAQCPVVPADTAVYWWAAQHLNLTLLPNMGRFKDLSYQRSH
jgi:maleate cis-trans isomerase